MKESDPPESSKIEKAPATPCVGSSFEERKDDAMEGSDAKDEVKDDDALISHMDKVEVKYEDAELNVESDDMTD